jgi:hypothetical protein
VANTVRRTLSDVLPAVYVNHTRVSFFNNPPYIDTCATQGESYVRALGYLRVNTVIHDDGSHGKPGQPLYPRMFLRDGSGVVSC